MLGVDEIGTQRKFLISPLDLSGVCTCDFLLGMPLGVPLGVFGVWGWVGAVFFFDCCGVGVVWRGVAGQGLGYVARRGAWGGSHKFGQNLSFFLLFFLSSSYFDL